MASIGKMHLQLVADHATFERGMSSAMAKMDSYSKSVASIGNVEREQARVAEQLHQMRTRSALAAAVKANDLKKIEEIQLNEKLRVLAKEQEAREKSAAAWKKIRLTALGVGTALAAAGAAMTTWGADSVTALYRTARGLGATSEGLSALEFTQKEMGQTTQDLFAGLQNLNGVLAQATYGSKFARDTFGRLGLNFAALTRLPVDQAFLKIARAVALLPDPTQRAAIASQLFGDKAGALLPLLSMGEAGLARYAETARKFGLTFNDLQGAAVEEAFAITTLRSAVEGLARQIAINLAPWVNGLIIAFKNWMGTGTAGAGVAGAVKSAFNALGGTLALLADVWRTATIGAKFFELALYGVCFAVTKLAALINDFTYAALPDFVKQIDAATGSLLKSGGTFADKWAENLGQGFDKANKELKKLLDAPSNRDQWKKLMEDITKQTDKFQKDMKKMREAGGAIAQFARDGQQFSQAANIASEVLTPFEQFSQKMTQINELVKAGAISWDVYQRSAAKAFLTLSQAHGLNELKAAGAVVRGTAAAYSASAASERQTALARESPAARTARILAQALEIERLQLAEQRRIAEALRANPKVEMVFP